MILETLGVPINAKSLRNALLVGLACTAVNGTIHDTRQRFTCEALRDGVSLNEITGGAEFPDATSFDGLIEACAGPGNRVTLDRKDTAAAIDRALFHGVNVPGLIVKGALKELGECNR